jgi:hypothetical protein
MIRKIEFIEASGRDLEFVFDCFFESLMSFGEGTNHALEHAVERIRHIRATAERPTPLPERSIARGDNLPGFRLFVMEQTNMGATDDPTESE